MPLHETAVAKVKDSHRIAQSILAALQDLQPLSEQM